MAAVVTADLVIVNGKIATVDKNFTYVEAVATRDGWIIDRGTTEEMKAYIGENTKVIDAGGKLVLPAANDSHCHAVHTGFTLMPGFLDFNGPQWTKLADVQAKIREAAEAAGPGEWVFGCGLVYDQIDVLHEEGRVLVKQDLDAATTDVPVIVTDFSLHCMIANSKALELAGIDDSYPEIPPSLGFIERDEEGHLNGRFVEWGAENILCEKLPILTDEEFMDCIRRVQAAFNKEGITSHEDILGEGGEYLFRGTWGTRPIEIYEQMAEKGELTARVSINIFSAIEGEETYSSIIRGTDRIKLPEFKDRNWVKADAIKFFVDLGGPTWQRPGIRQTDPVVSWKGTEEEYYEEIKRTIIELHRKGWQVCVHSCGGGSNDCCAEAMFEANQLYPGKDLRHFLIHVDDMTLDLAKKCGENGVLAAIQPSNGDIVFEGNCATLTDKDRCFNWQGCTDAGIIFTGGSDTTCFPINWRKGMQFAVTRKTSSGFTAHPELAMNREDAIRMYTINGAYQEHLENVRGSIEINKVADFQILDTDVMTCPAEEIGQSKVVMTICDGKVVYEA
ncbi:amidohydrolase [uncultured Enorma sp.]|uniref:amidohydrolase n=1 Tax=uncultured Enorma sp. TaxID=1714346 RepID=UPI002805E73C|nr:amidohydrolase [uncultured Enorma sp.]